MFTSTLTDSSLAAIVRGIEAQGFKGFATPPTGQAADKGLLVYHVAFSAPGSGWTLREVIALRTGEGEYQIQEKNIISGASFFDALHMAAQKFQARLSLGHSVQDSAAIKEALACDHLIDFRDAAKKSGQPMDHQGLPVPAAGGYILVPGMYNNIALKLARTTEKRAMTPVATAQTNFNDVMGANAQSFVAQGEAALPVPLVTQLSAALGAKNKMVEFMKHTVETAKGGKPLQDFRIMSTVFSGIGSGFAGAIAPKLAATWFLFAVEPVMALTAGGVCAVTTGATIMYATSEKGQFSRHLARLKSATKVLPAGPQKQMLNEFVQWSQAVFHLERAAFFHTKHKNNLSKTKFFHKALSEARRGLEILGTSAEQIAAVEEGIKNGNFPDIGHFHEKLAAMSGRWTEPTQQFSARVATPALSA